MGYEPLTAAPQMLYHIFSSVVKFNMLAPEALRHSTNKPLTKNHNLGQKSKFRCKIEIFDGI